MDRWQESFHILFNSVGIITQSKQLQSSRNQRQLNNPSEIHQKPRSGHER